MKSITAILDYDLRVKEIQKQVLKPVSSIRAGVIQIGARNKKCSPGPRHICNTHEPLTKTSTYKNPLKHHWKPLLALQLVAWLFSRTGKYVIHANETNFRYDHNGCKPPKGASALQQEKDTREWIPKNKLALL